MDDKQGGHLPAQDEDKRAISARRYGLAIASLSSFCTSFLISALNVALPALQKEYQMNTVLLSWVAMVSILTSAMFVVPIGRLSDIYGRKRIFTIGVAVFTIAVFLCGFSFSPATLIAAMVIHAMGAAMIFSTNMAIVTAVYPADQRGKALGITVATVYLGLSTGPFLGGLLTGYLGWRSIFFAVAPLGLVVFLMIRLKLKQEWLEARGERFDLPGAVIYSLSLFLIIYGFSLLPGSTGFLLLGAGIAGGIVFFWWENRTSAPILQIGFLKGNRIFAFSNLAALIHYSATSAVTFLMSLYLQYVRGMSPQHAGVILVCQPLVQAVLTPFAGKLSDKVEPRIVASIGMGMTGLSLLSFSLLTDSTSLAVIIANLAFLGTGFALFSSPNTNAIMSAIDKRYYGIGSGILATGRMIGQAFSMGFTMLVFVLLLGRVQITPDLYPLFLKAAKILFLIFAVFCCGSIAASLARGKVHPSS